MATRLLEIENLHAGVEGLPILKGLSLSIGAGEVHAIMGPNGSGKSTLAKVLAGKPEVKIASGTVTYNGQDLLTMEPELRAREGVFMAFQYPVEIPGVKNGYFLRLAVNAVRKHRGQEELDPFEFQKKVDTISKLLHMKPGMLSRSLNEGFSGGEKKLNEILQMTLLEPRLVILDETDSGLDIDALRIVSEGVNRFRSPTTAVLMITHYQRMLEYVQPDHIHVLMGGSIVHSGDHTLSRTLEDKGYDWLKQEVAV